MVAPSATPALLKMRLTWPWSATTWSAQANTASRSATSTRCDVTFTPRPSHSGDRLGQAGLVDVGERQVRAAAGELARPAPGRCPSRRR